MSYKISKILGRGLPLRGNDTDTDRIIPARYLKSVTFENLGNNVFYDERYDEKGKSKPHSFNSDKYQDGSILIVNQNFGCGSSREHAAHAIKNFGIKAVIGESFGEIFEGNCISIGIPVLKLKGESVEKLMTTVENYPTVEIIINIFEKSLQYNDSYEKFDMSSDIHHVLTEGKWDQTNELLENIGEIKNKAATLPYMNF